MDEGNVLMKIGIIGCGYVFDHYMTTVATHPILEIAGVTDIDRTRVKAVTNFYKLKAYDSNEAMLADPEIKIIANFTPIKSHYEVSKAALEAGKHVYSEKPLVTNMDDAFDLIQLADKRELRVSCAPSNVLGATSRTVWKVVTDGAIGDVRLVYAEFDDNPIYLMQPERWRSRSGAPWPYLHEYEMGCTWEHVGYHLSWMCAIFGPVRSVTAFSKHTLPDKTARPLTPPDTPDFSVACLDFESGVVGRVTCSIAAPYDHRMRVIGNRGMVYADTYRHYECPVYLEPFTKLSLNARKARSVRSNTFLQWPFGVGGRRVPLLRCPPPGAARMSGPSWNPKTMLTRWKQKELGLQDKCIGIAELAAAISEGRPSFPPHAFTLHITELTLAIQGAGPNGTSSVLKTRFDPFELPAWSKKTAPDYNQYVGVSLLDRIVGKVLDRMHEH